jgi:hypothetical protein
LESFQLFGIALPASFSAQQIKYVIGSLNCMTGTIASHGMPKMLNGLFKIWLSPDVSFGLRIGVCSDCRGIAGHQVKGAAQAKVGIAAKAAGHNLKTEDPRFGNSSAKPFAAMHGQEYITATHQFE